MPDGEVYYGPVEDSANGYIYFPYDNILQGNKISGIKLWYKNGEIIKFKAKKNEALLKNILSQEGMKRIGEFGIGCNYGIKKYTNNILFDEKIGGTIHIALGRSYKEPLNAGGGLNDAMLHIDVICDLRKIPELNPGGIIKVDGREVQKNGEWLV